MIHSCFVVRAVIVKNSVENLVITATFIKGTKRLNALLYYNEVVTISFISLYDTWISRAITWVSNIDIHY